MAPSASGGRWGYNGRRMEVGRVGEQRSSTRLRFQLPHIITCGSTFLQTPETQHKSNHYTKYWKYARGRWGQLALSAQSKPTGLMVNTVSRDPCLSVWPPMIFDDAVVARQNNARGNSISREYAEFLALEGRVQDIAVWQNVSWSSSIPRWSSLLSLLYQARHSSRGQRPRRLCGTTKTEDGVHPRSRAPA